MEFTTAAAAKKLTGLSYLGGINTSAKIVKNQKVNNQNTYIIYLAPASQSGHNVCKFSTPECRLGCLASSGRAAMDEATGKNIIKKARIKKSKLLIENEKFFMAWMISEMTKFKAKSEKDGYYFSARLNGTSDINYKDIKVDGKNIFEIFPDVQFYDYTKDFNKMHTNNVPNYYLTFSYTGTKKNIENSKTILQGGGNIAVVFDIKKGQDLPKTFMGCNVVDGDVTDYRKADGEGVVVGLRWKNIANKEAQEQIKNSVFVVKSDNDQCTW